MAACEEMVILAGGRGTRLQSVVNDVPKPLATVAGRPFLHWLLDAAVQAGMRHVILATGYLGQMISAAVGSAWQGMSVSYSMETAPLGTGGAMAQACSQLRDARGCHVRNGDTWLDYSPQRLEDAVHASRDARIGLMLAEVLDVARYGSVATQGAQALALVEKGGHGPGAINAGSYYLGPQAVSELPGLPSFSFEEDVLRPAVALGQVVVASGGNFIDIGIPEDYRRAQQWFSGDERGG